MAVATTELTTTDFELAEGTGFKVDFKPAIIDVQNYEELETKVGDFLNKYKSLVYTEDNYKEGQQTANDLKKLAKEINEKRLEVQRATKKPLADFEAKMNSLKSQIESTQSEIETGISRYEQLELANRKNGVIEVVNGIYVELDITQEVADKVVLNEKWWINKSTTPAKIKKEITDQVETIQKDIEIRNQNVEIIIDTAKELNIPNQEWISRLDGGLTIAEVIAGMKTHKQQVIELEEENKRQAEARRAVEEAQQEQVGNKVVNTKTGEVVAEIKTFAIYMKTDAKTANKLFNVVKTDPRVKKFELREG